MNILYVHNFYRNPGGEDRVFLSESALLEARGHTVQRYSVHNDAVSGMSPLSLASALIWNGKAHDEIRRIVREGGIEVVHFHNTFPLISPAAYSAAKSEGARVVQTLHNFRLICPGALLLREGRVCEDCLGKTPWRGVLHACYRDSRLESAAVASMLVSHRVMGTWESQVDIYIALSDFTRDKFIEGGLPADKIVVKPNFVDPDPGAGAGRGGYALFVGRLSPEKGVAVLLEAWAALGKRITLRIAGDGPMKEAVRRASGAGSGIEYLGQQSANEVRGLMRDAAFLVVPSVWYEAAVPLTVIEAHASGLPVIASRLGSMASICRDRETGLLFEPGSAADLATQVEWLLAHPERAAEMRLGARHEYATRYSAAANYSRLMRIYGDPGHNSADIEQPASGRVAG